jgi:hypothetical protein
MNLYLFKNEFYYYRNYTIRIMMKNPVMNLYGLGIMGVCYDYANKSIFQSPKNPNSRYIFIGIDTRKKRD